MDNENLKSSNAGNDLPKELTEYLMKNHPLKGESEERPVKNRHNDVHYGRKEAEERRRNESAAPYEGERRDSRRTSSMLEAVKNKTLKESAVSKEDMTDAEIPDDSTKKIDVSQVRKMREELKAETEIKESKEREAAVEKQPEKKQNQKFGEIDYVFDDDEPVQVIRHKAKEKPHSVIKTGERAKSEKTIDDRMFFAPQQEEDFESLSESMEKNKKNSPRPEGKKKGEHKHEMRNLRKEEKGAALDSFFMDNENEDFEDDDRQINYMKIGMIVGVIFIFLFIFFAVRTVSLSGKLSDAEDQIASLESLQQENEELKINKLALEEEIQSYKDGENTENNDDENSSSGEAEAPQGEENPSEIKATTEYDVYTVVEGDTFSTISTKVYGTYSGYKKIMEANGITNENGLQIGQKLKIPKN